jgi:uncharacterized membrane protein YphA (DoxX/SURF4 family)
MPQTIPSLVLLLQVSVAAVLVWTGGSKLADPSSIRRTIEALGLPWPNALAASLGCSEVALGLTLVLFPHSWFTAVLLAGLGATFGAAGAWALLKHVQVECACFGATRSALLGRRQLLLLPGWLLVAVTVMAVPPPMATDRPALALAVLVAVALGILVRLEPLYREHRAQRMAIEGS